MKIRNKLCLIYTDASCYKNSYSLAGVLVQHHHIKDVYYFKGLGENTSVNAEKLAIEYSLEYFSNKYPTKIFKIVSDCRPAIKKCSNLLNLKWVKGHQSLKRKSYKYKFNDLADYIAKHGIENWKEYWYDKL